MPITFLSYFRWLFLDFRELRLLRVPKIIRKLLKNDQFINKFMIYKYYEFLYFNLIYISQFCTQEKIVVIDLRNGGFNIPELLLYYFWCLSYFIKRCKTFAVSLIQFLHLTSSLEHLWYTRDMMPLMISKNLFLLHACITHTILSILFFTFTSLFVL